VSPDRSPGGEPLRTTEGRFVHVVASRCPYAPCASLVFGLAERDEVTRLVDRRLVGRAFAKRAFADAADNLFASFFGVLCVAVPLAGMVAAFAHPTRGCGSMLVVLGGTILVVPATVFVLLGTIAFVQQWRTTWRARAKVLAGGLGGLRLAPSPRAYRAH
jgi:hypothetical protein